MTQPANKQQILDVLNVLKDYKDNKKNLFKNQNYDIMVTFNKGADEIDDAIKQFKELPDDAEIEHGDFCLLVGHKKALENGEPIDAAVLVFNDDLGYSFDASFDGSFGVIETNYYQKDQLDKLVQDGLKMLKKEADKVAKKYEPKRPKL